MEYITTIDELHEHETYKKVQELCEKFGYKLHTIIRELHDEWEFRRCEIYPDKEKNKFTPDIYYIDETPFGDTHNYVFEIQTIAYGACKAKEYGKFLGACNNAYQLIKELEKISINDWPTRKMQTIIDAMLTTSVASNYIKRERERKLQ